MIYFYMRVCIEGVSLILDWVTRLKATAFALFSQTETVAHIDLSYEFRPPLIRTAGACLSRISLILEFS